MDFYTIYYLSRFIQSPQSRHWTVLTPYVALLSPHPPPPPNPQLVSFIQRTSFSECLKINLIKQIDFLLISIIKLEMCSHAREINIYKHWIGATDLFNLHIHCLGAFLEAHGHKQHLFTDNSQVCIYGSNLSPEGQSVIFNCLPTISTCMKTRHIAFNMRQMQFWFPSPHLNHSFRE